MNRRWEFAFPRQLRAALDPGWAWDNHSAPPCVYLGRCVVAGVWRFGPTSWRGSARASLAGFAGLGSLKGVAREQATAGAKPWLDW